MTDESNEDISYRKRFAPSEKDVLKHIQKIHQSKDNDTTKQRFLVEIRNSTDKAEEKLSECLKTQEHLKMQKTKSSCYGDYGSKMSNLKDTIENIKDSGRLKSFYFPCVPELVDEETQRYINEINKISKDRTSYGIREEITDKKSILLAWSDASKAWYPYGWKIYESIKTGKKEYSHIVKKDMKVKLDANQILVPDNKDLDRLGHAASCSNPLPLYSLSFEAVHERRETPLLPGLLTWLERQAARLKERQEREKYV